MRMTRKEFSRELRYQTLAFFVRQMLEEGLISEEEYCRIDEMNRKKYQPVTGSLLSGKFLLCAPDRVNICTEKEEQRNAEYSEN